MTEADFASLGAVLAFLGAVIGALITIMSQSFANWRGKRARARYLGIRVVIILDKLVIELANVASDDGYKYNGFQTEYAEVTFKVPEAPDYPDNLDWQVIDSELAYQILSIPHKFWQAHTIVNDAATHYSPPSHEEFYSIRRKEWGELGSEIWRITQELRRKYSIDSSIYEGLSPQETIVEEFGKLAKDKRA